jgi:hypothetical protein
MDGRVHEWLLLIYKVPREPTSRRVAVWRRLRRLGAMLLHDAAWILPANQWTREQVQWVATEIMEMEGEVTVWESRLTYGEDQALIEQFQAQVAPTYAAILAELRQKDADLIALSRRYQQARALDYFPSELEARARESLLKARESVGR